MSSILPPIGLDNFHDASLSRSGPTKACDVVFESSRSPLVFCSAASLVASSPVAFSWSFDFRRCFFWDSFGSSFGSRFRFKDAVSPFTSIFEVIPGCGRNGGTGAAIWTKQNKPMPQDKQTLRPSPIAGRQKKFWRSRQKKLEWGILLIGDNDMHRPMPRPGKQRFEDPPRHPARDQRIRQSKIATTDRILRRRSRLHRNHHTPGSYTIIDRISANI